MSIHLTAPGGSPRGRPQLGSQEKSAQIELPFEALQKGIETLSACTFVDSPIEFSFFASLPFPSEKEDTLSEVEGAEVRICLKSYEDFRAGYRRIIEAGRFRPENNGDLSSLFRPLCEPAHGIG